MKIKGPFMGGGWYVRGFVLLFIGVLWSALNLYAIATFHSKPGMEAFVVLDLVSYVAGSFGSYIAAKTMLVDFLYGASGEF